MSESDWQSKYVQRLTRFTVSFTTYRDQHRIRVEPQELKQVLRELLDAGMDMLIDITAVDLLEYEGATDRFEVIYCLLNTESGERLVVRTYLNEPDMELPSVTDLWRAADWLEREVYDMYGVRFIGHPNFKRLLLPQEFASYPLRKDYPVKGRGERHNFPVITRAKS